MREKKVKEESYSNLGLSQLSSEWPALSLLVRPPRGQAPMLHCPMTPPALLSVHIPHEWHAPSEENEAHKIPAEDRCAVRSHARVPGSTARYACESPRQ